MDNAIQKIQAEHDLFNTVLDLYNQSMIKQDLAIIDALTFRKDTVKILDRFEDDECLLKAMHPLVNHIENAEKISEVIDDLTLALFSALNMKNIPKTLNYLHEIFKTKLYIFSKSEVIFRAAFNYIALNPSITESIAEIFSFIEHAGFLDRIVSVGIDSFMPETKIFLSQLDFSFFRHPHIFTIFQDKQYQSLFANYLKCYSFLKSSDSLSEKNKEIHQDFVKNFIEYYIYYDMKSFLHTRQGYIIKDLPAEQVAEILNNINFLRHLNFDKKGSSGACNNALNLIGIEKYLDSTTFKAISGRASRFGNILKYLRDKPTIIEDIISDKIKNDYIFSTLIILSRWKGAFWFSSSFLDKSPISFIRRAFDNHKKIKDHQLKKLGFKILDFINHRDWNDRLYYLAHNYSNFQEYYDIDEIIYEYFLEPDYFFMSNYINDEFKKTRKINVLNMCYEEEEENNANDTAYLNKIDDGSKNERPISVCFFTDEQRDKKCLNNIQREVNPDMSIEKEENNDIDSTLKSVSKKVLEDLEKVQSYPSEKTSDYEFGEPDENSMGNYEIDEYAFLNELPKNQLFFAREEGSDTLKEMTFEDFLSKKQEQNKKIEMKMSPDNEGKTLYHNAASMIIYAASAEAELDQHIEDLGDESKGVVALYKKIKRLGNSRNLYNNDLLFKNIDSLREAFPNFSYFIDHIEGHAILNRRGHNHFYIPPSLLVGEPGIGKTFFLAEMAELFGIKREIIHMETISASWLLTGASAQWKDAKAGLIFNKTINSTHANNMVILDELDKSLNSSNYPPANSLLQLFEHHTAKEFKDEYFPLKIDVSKMVWLATANDLSTISEPLLSRLDTFRIINPNFEERKQLARRIYSSILKTNTWGSSFDNDLSDTALDKLCQPSDSIREMKKTLMNAIKNCAKRDAHIITLEDISFDTNQSKSTIGFR